VGLWTRRARGGAGRRVCRQPGMPAGVPPGPGACPTMPSYAGPAPSVAAGPPPPFGGMGIPAYAPPSLGLGPPPPMPPPGVGGGGGSVLPPGGGAAAQLAPPASATAGIPDPGAIARQKDVYLKMLDEQLKQGVTVLDQQVKYQRDYLNVQCEQQKKQFLLQLDQQMKAQEMVLTQQYNEQLMALQMQAGSQKAALEQQAMQLTMEYEQRKAEEHMYRQQYEIQRQQSDMATRLAQDYQRMQPPTVPGFAPPLAVRPPSMAPVGHPPPYGGGLGASQPVMHASYAPAPIVR